jgi:hypothetical protein
MKGNKHDLVLWLTASAMTLALAAVQVKLDCDHAKVYARTGYYAR